MIRNLVAFTAAALLEILGCFTFWLWLRRGASPTIAAVGIFSLIGFAVALTYGGRRSRLCVRQERRRSARARCATSDSAAARAQDAGATRARTPTVVPSRTAVACRARRPHQPCSSHNTVCDAVDITAPTALLVGSGLGVTANNLMNTALFLNARATA
jgi:Uncharacterised BCR, YnfA/UPF0060 family